MTNREFLKTASDEELIKFLFDCHDYRYLRCVNNEEMKKWLNEEHKEKQDDKRKVL